MRSEKEIKLALIELFEEDINYQVGVFEHTPLQEIREVLYSDKNRSEVSRTIGIDPNELRNHEIDSDTGYLKRHVEDLKLYGLQFAIYDNGEFVTCDLDLKKIIKEYLGLDLRFVAYDLDLGHNYFNTKHKDMSYKMVIYKDIVDFLELELRIIKEGR